MRKGWIRVDGKRAKPHQRLKLAQQVRLTRPGLATPTTTSQQPTLPKKLLHKIPQWTISENPDFIVVNKPPGIVVHKGSGHPFGLADLVQSHKQSNFIAPIGRLDRDVSGAMIFALNRATARHLETLKSTGQLGKTYAAIVFGHPKTQSIDAELTPKSGAIGHQRTITAPNPSDKTQHASTTIQHAKHLTIQNIPVSILHITIETGRTHQIRTHLAHIGHPILGDPRYNSKHSSNATNDLKIDRLLLHAQKLELKLPQLSTFEAPLPHSFTQVLDQA